ncbi:acyl-CoA/acyl-ACP dehydrogenase [Bradyrhizobium brasilense]|uniref:acyl-CoA dehydrogenase family protein n=1 Tax=Bradyrhizobium brasilense TaxID=1419277 RepID=UPI0024B28456|nr:acyl-CoA dehydrogenase family protein [Bradyrhizobium australafricanum]WFU31337.1 acyl-CoA/acyl-ACP dehydrogenase [Bradyrhizobium australafricanum]
MYEFKQETQALVELVRRIVKDHQAPLETRKLRGEKLTSADFQPGRDAARKSGLWGLGLPRSLGGAELCLVDRLAVIEENRKSLTPIRFGGEALPDLLRLEDEQKARYLDPFLSDATALCFALTEPSGGSDPARNTSTRAKRDGKGWLINGSKLWVSDFDEADRVFVFARIAKEETASSISMFVVEKGNPGLIARAVPMLGGYTTHQLILEDCRVDEIARIGAEGAGFKGAQDALNATRFANAAATLGIAQRCYDMMVEYAKGRVLFGGALSDKQAIQSMIIDSWIEIQQNRLMVYTCAEKHDRGEDTRVEASMTKLTCTEMVGRVIDRAIQIHGGTGCTYESPLAHWYDTQRMSRIWVGPSEVLKYRVLARHLLTSTAA